MRMDESHRMVPSMAWARHCRHWFATITSPGTLAVSEVFRGSRRSSFSDRRRGGHASKLRHCGENAKLIATRTHQAVLVNTGGGARRVLGVADPLAHCL